VKYSWLQKKTGSENFHNVNLVLSICQLIVYLIIPIKEFLKLSLNFYHNSNLSLARFHTIKMCQFYSDSFRFLFFFCNQLQLTKEENPKKNSVIIL
jgi:hypothetical protein